MSQLSKVIPGSVGTVVWPHFQEETYRIFRTRSARFGSIVFGKYVMDTVPVRTRGNVDKNAVLCKLFLQKLIIQTLEIYNR
jgi:hypothetical protein